MIAKHGTKVRFIIVGTWNTVFGYLVFVGLDSLFAPLFGKRYMAYLAASLLSNIVAITNAYICHKYLTFKSEVRGKSILFEFARFLSTYIFTIILGLALLPVLVELLYFDPKIAAALIILATTLVSYFGHSRFSFNVKGVE
jgi:putative flippase GtrA